MSSADDSKNHFVFVYISRFIITQWNCSTHKMIHFIGLR